MDEHILTTLKILIIGECGVGKSRLVQVHFRFIYVWSLEVVVDGLLFIEMCYNDDYCFIFFVFIAFLIGSSMMNLIPPRLRLLAWISRSRKSQLMTIR
jgi:hypothetical protein